MEQFFDAFILSIVKSLPISILCVLASAYLVRKLFSSYVDEKQKNIATKEDIKEITQKQEEVIKDLEFKYKYNFDRYANLYSPLYAIIMQSEYIRHLVGEKKIDNSFDNYPFYELSEKKNEYAFLNEEPLSSVDVHDDVTDSNKINMIKRIINNEKYASQELLKMAREYMVVYKFYSGNKNNPNVDEFQTKVDAEEVELIKEIVIDIVKEFNELRKYLNMDYNQQELESGIPTMSKYYSQKGE